MRRQAVVEASSRGSNRFPLVRQYGIPCGLRREASNLLAKRSRRTGPESMLSAPDRSPVAFPPPSFDIETEREETIEGEEEVMQSITNHHPPQRPTLKRHGKVIGGVEPQALDAVTQALIASNFSDEQIEIITRDEMDCLNIPTSPGVTGRLTQLFQSLGGDLDELEQEREELEAGHVLVCVHVAGEDDQYLVRDIMRGHGGQSINYFGRWTIKALA